MRPTRLSLSGFSAFRDLVEVDFSDTDLFAFTGPTGSGKSSLIDAMVFALYGCVPRLDQRAVAPVISLGRNEARVRLDFTVAGEQYTAARVVRRTKAGATTKEARLERADGEVLAGNEKELSAEVERLLGLGFGHFTTCVVLPQGDFARFLHAQDKERQQLLVSLLDLGQYRRMAGLAYQREQTASRKAEVARSLLESLAFATPEALAEAEARVEQLVALRADVEQALPQLEDLGWAEEAAAGEAARAAAESDLLAGVVAPGRVGVDAAARAAARRALEQAEAEAEQRTVASDEAEKVLAAMPFRRVLEQAHRAHVEHTSAVAEQQKRQVLVGDRARVVEESEAALAAAAVTCKDARIRLERVQWEHRAHDLAASLVTGEPCPVCRQMVTELPEESAGDAVAAVPAARASAERAEAEVAAAQRAHRAAERSLLEVNATLESIAARLDALAGTLAEHPDPEPIEEALASLDAAEQAGRRVQRDARTAHQAAVAARKVLEDHDRAEAAARRRFDEARDRVAALGPPPAQRDDLAADWAALAAWAASARPGCMEAASDAARRAESARRERARVEADLVARCAAADVIVRSPRDVRSAVADAAAAATVNLDRIKQAIAEAAAQRAALATHTSEADLAHELKRLLSVQQFEKWVLDETLAGLVAGATSLLRELSGGAYSLALDERSSFNVIDHRNADERRSARTLSGGETFLASLALALALADQIGSLAAGGSARLESIFLDEGFGTLDPDTLDTVASAIEELGARGRMVGLISHVPELAERVPVRFEVSRGPAGSTVSRVAT